MVTRGTISVARVAGEFPFPAFRVRMNSWLRTGWRLPERTPRPLRRKSEASREPSAALQLSILSVPNSFVCEHARDMPTALSLNASSPKHGHRRVVEMRRDDVKKTLKSATPGAA